jgi:membrane-associated protease RseP (regulator of RpoE activity)
MDLQPRRTDIEFSQQDSDRNRWARLASLAVAAVVAIAVVWAAGFPPAEWLSRLHALASEPAPTVPQPGSEANTPAPQAAAQALPTVDVNALPGTDSSLSKIPLALYLLAAAPGRNVTEGTAQIGTSIDNPQTYMAGAMLVNGARLVEIHSDHVVLRKGERSARLDLYTRTKPAAASSNELLSVGSESTPVASSKPAKRDSLIDYLRPSAVYDDQTLRGVKVFPGKKSGVFAQLGLRAGDVITAIDGSPLIGRAETIQTLRQLTEGAALSVTVERAETRIQMTLDGAVILADLEQSEMVSQSLAPNQPTI